MTIAHTYSETLPLPPLAKGLPIVGSVFDLAGDMIDFAITQYRQLGPVFRVKALNRELVFIVGPDANVFFTKEGHAYCRSAEVFGSIDREFESTRSVISMDGPDHIRMRKIQSRGYSRSYSSDYYPMVVDIAQNEANQWTTPTSAISATRRIITQQIGTMMTGCSPADYVEDLVTYLRISALVYFSRIYPKIMLKSPQYKQAKKRVIEFGRQILDFHRNNENTNHVPDFIDDLLNLQEQDPEFFPETDIMVAVITPFVAGIDTAANTTAFLLYALLKNPVLYEQATAEADALFANGVPTPDQLRNADILHRLAIETLRRYPIVPAMQRTVVEPFNYQGYRIEAGTSLVIGTTAPHFFPELYPDPYRFDIDRYLPERKEHKQRGAFAPFGLGPHTCLGAGMAEVLIMLTTATLLHTSRIRMKAPYELKIDRHPTQKPDKHFKIHVAERRNRIVTHHNE